jgi:predicted deacylase
MLFHVETIEGERPGPHLLITAGVHGDEWEPIVTARELAQELRSGDLAGRLTIVPVANEPAFRLGRRVGEDGKDLARTCPGCAEGSPTERIAHELSELMRSADYYVDLHTGGTQLRIWPLAGYLIHPDVRVLQTQRRMARAFGLPVVWGTDPKLEGRTLSVARNIAIPAIYVEYLGSGALNRAAVRALKDGCLNVMATIGIVRRPQPSDVVRFFAEDDRPGSGHLQICHPAPTDGLFEACVELGDKIECGMPLGYVAPDGAYDRTEILAQSSGRVVSIRSLPRIAAGDGLAVIVDFAETNV